MAALRKLEFFLLRYVPNAVTERFVTIGLIVREPGPDGSGFAAVRFTKDWREAQHLDPEIDLEMLEALERDFRQQLKETGSCEALLKRLEDSHSNIIQLSSRKSCVTTDPDKETKALESTYFEAPRVGTIRELPGKLTLRLNMTNALDKTGISDLLRDLPSAGQAKYGFKFDFGYRIGETLKFFQAVSLKASMDPGVRILANYPKIAGRIAQDMHLQSFLTAVVEDDLDRSGIEMQFMLNALEEKSIRIAAVAEMPSIAEQAKKELRA